MTEETVKKVKFVQTHHEKSVIRDIDAWDMGRYMYRLLEKNEEKDKVIKALIEEVCYLSHFIAKSHPDYIDFLNKAKNVEAIIDDDSLEMNLNPPQPTEADLVTRYDPKKEKKYVYDWEAITEEEDLFLGKDTPEKPKRTILKTDDPGIGELITDDRGWDD